MYFNSIIFVEKIWENVIDDVSGQYFCRVIVGSCIVEDEFNVDVVGFVWIFNVNVIKSDNFVGLKYLQCLVFFILQFLVLIFYLLILLIECLCVFFFSLIVYLFINMYVICLNVRKLGGFYCEFLYFLY